MQRTQALLYSPPKLRSKQAAPEPGVAAAGFYRADKAPQVCACMLTGCLLCCVRAKAGQQGVACWHYCIDAVRVLRAHSFCAGARYPALRAGLNIAAAQSLDSQGMAAAVDALRTLDKEVKKLPQAVQARSLEAPLTHLGDLRLSFASPGGPWTVRTRGREA